MSPFTRRIFYWAPRAISIAFILFLSMFALDVFGHGQGFWRTLAALAIHLIPGFVLIAVVVLAWRWEWVGAGAFAAAGSFYVWMVLRKPLPPAIQATWIATIAGPAFFIAALFVASWWTRTRSRSA